MTTSRRAGSNPQKPPTGQQPATPPAWTATDLARTEHLVLDGVLTAEQAAETVAGILAVQRTDGAIPW